MSCPVPTLIKIAVSVISLSTLLVLPSAGRAQRESYRTWSAIAAQKRISPRFYLYMDINARFFDNLDVQQIHLRPAIGFKLLKNMIAWVGYAWTPTWSNNRDYIDEHRIWQQLTYSTPPLDDDGLTIHFRSRLEQRFRAAVDCSVGWRFRQIVRIQAPLFAWARSHVSVWDEAFVTFNRCEQPAGRPWQRQGFDQNRVFIGLGIYPIKTMRVELGYLHQFIVGSSPTEINHIALLNATLNLR